MGSIGGPGCEWACVILQLGEGDYYAIPWAVLGGFRLPAAARATVAAFLDGEDVVGVALPSGSAPLGLDEGAGEEVGRPSGRAPPRTSRRLDTLWLVAP